MNPHFSALMDSIGLELHASSARQPTQTASAAIPLHALYAIWDSTSPQMEHASLATCLSAQPAHQYNASHANPDTFRNPEHAPNATQSSCILNFASLAAHQHV